MTPLLPPLVLGALLAAGPDETSSSKPEEPVATAHEDFAWVMFWWDRQRDRLLPVRARIRALHPELVPDAKQITEEVLPVLERMLEDEDDVEPLCHAALALAKAGRHLADARPVLGHLRPLLAHQETRVSATAALALGVTRCPATLADLTALARDDAQGHSLVGRPTVPAQVRVRALYGLALLAEHAGDAGIDAAVLLTAQEFLTGSTHLEELALDLKIAALQAVSMVGGDASPERASESLATALDLLAALPEELDEQVQAHLPIAVAKLLRRGHARGVPGTDVRLRAQIAAWQAELRELADDPPPQPPPLPDPPPGVWAPQSDPEFELPVLRSVVSALGMLAPLVEDQASVDASVELLVRIAQSTVERQTRYLALMALGEIGTEAAVDRLLATIRETEDLVARGWCGLALGIHVATAEVAEPRVQQIAQTLVQRLDAAKGSYGQLPLVNALALIGSAEALPVLRELPATYPLRDDLTAEVALALGLLGDQESREPLRALFEASERRPSRAFETGRALALLDDDTWSTTARQRLGSANLAAMALAAALLCEAGDRRHVLPLLQACRDAKSRPVVRAIAAAALGSICDPDPSHLAAGIADHVAHRSMPPSMADWQDGILELF